MANGMLQTAWLTKDGNSLSRKYIVLFLIVFIGTITSACAGSPTKPEEKFCTAATFTPNWVVELAALGWKHWERFPTVVYVDQSTLRSSQEGNGIVAGLYVWSTATNGVFSVSTTSSEAQAQIVIRLVDQISSGFDGFTATDMVDGSLIRHAVITVRHASSPSIDFEWARGLVAHEMGHALGWVGHPVDASDLMDGANHLPTLMPVPSLKDVNTLKTTHCNLFQ